MMQGDFGGIEFRRGARRGKAVRGPRPFARLNRNDAVGTPPSRRLRAWESPRGQIVRALLVHYSVNTLRCGKCPPPPRLDGVSRRDGGGPTASLRLRSFLPELRFCCLGSARHLAVVHTKRCPIAVSDCQILKTQSPPQSPLISNGALDRTRTCNLLIRSQKLYPIELRAHQKPNRRRESGQRSRLRQAPSRWNSGARRCRRDPPRRPRHVAVAAGFRGPSAGHAPRLVLRTGRAPTHNFGKPGAASGRACAP